MSPITMLSLVVPLFLGAFLVARDAFLQRRGFDLTLATAVLAWIWITLGTLALGLFGMLWFGPLLVWSVLASVIGLSFRARRGAAGAVPRDLEPPEPWNWPATVALGLVLATAAVLFSRSLVWPVKVVSDGPIYHLYFAARWWKSARIFLIPTPFGENAAPYFPANGDVWFTWLFTGWGGERLAKVGQAPFLVLAGAASYALARRLASGPTAAAIATCFFVSSLPLLLFTFEPNVDTIFVAGYLVACYFFLRYALGDDGIASLVLGGLAAGLAWGTKPTGTVFVPVLLAPIGVLIVARERNLRRSIGCIAALAFSVALPCGFWFARNGWLTGNPLYPLQVTLFGHVLGTGWYASDVMRQSQYYLPARDVTAFVDILLSVIDPRLAPFWLAALAGAWAIGRSPTREDRWVWGCSFLALFNVALYWLLIPYRTQQRFMLQALGLAAVPLARLLDRSRLLRILGTILIGLRLFSRQGWPLGDSKGHLPWDLNDRIPNSIPGPLWPRDLLTTTFGVIVLAAIFVAWTLGRIRKSVLLARLGLVVALVLVGIAIADQETELDSLGLKTMRTFPFFPDYFRGWTELDQRSGQQGVRVAYAGTNLPYYLMCGDFRNEVRYVNVNRHRDWLLHDYHALARGRGRPNWPHPRPGWDRLEPDYQAWLANLRAEGIQLLVVTRADPVEGRHNVADARGFPIERTWADAHPESFELLYGDRERDPLFRIYRVIPNFQLEPARKPATLRSPIR